MATAKKLPSGSWRCQVFSHYEPQFYPDGSPIMDPKTGKQKQKRIYESFTSTDPTPRGKKEAELMAAQFAAEKDTRAKQRPEDITLYDAIDRYISIKGAVLSASTISGYRKIQKYAFRSLMGMMIKDITTQKIIDSVSQETVRKPRQKKDAKAISPKTVKNEFGLLTAVLNYYNVEYDERKIRLPAIPEKKIDLPEPEDIFRAVRGTEIELPVLLAMWLSFTRSEIAGLTKSKSILGNGTYIAVNEVILTVNGHEIVKDTGKQPKRQRVLKLPPYIKQLIDKTDSDEDRIVPMKSDRIYRQLQRCLDAAGIQRITFHQLRHVNASVMHLLNIPEQYAQDRGGWSTSYVMRKNYTHAFSRERTAADQAIDLYFNDIVQHEMQHEKKKAQ